MQDTFLEEPREPCMPSSRALGSGVNEGGGGLKSQRQETMCLECGNKRPQAHLVTSALFNNDYTSQASSTIITLILLSADITEL